VVRRCTPGLTAGTTTGAATALSEPNEPKESIDWQRGVP
jgi:hypothetical protein